MPQSSAPIVGVNLSDTDWRDSFGDEAGVLGDLDGTAYKLTLPTDSDTLTVGSGTQRSMARVAGFIHRIPAGETETITVPAASGSSRTDIVGLLYDPTYTGAPGPVRLARVAGTSAGIPSYDDAAPGVELLPLWAVTRQPGQGLSQATLRDLRPRLAPVIDLPAGAPLPLSSPLGTIVRQGTAEYRRQLGSGGAPVWAPLAQSGTDWITPGLAGFSHRSGQTVQYMRDAAGRVHFRGSMSNHNSFAVPSALIFTLPSGFRPQIPCTFPISTNTSPFNANVSFDTAGRVIVSAFVGTTPAGRAFYFNGISYAAAS